MTTSKIKLFRNLSFGALIVLITIATVHIVVDIIKLSHVFTSFPWHAPIFLTGIHYVLPILILLCLTIAFSVILKKHKK